MALLRLRQVKYLNNIVEQDHRRIKRLVRPGLGFGSLPTARRTLAGYEGMAMIRKGQVRNIGGGDMRARPPLSRACSGSRPDLDPATALSQPPLRLLLVWDNLTGHKTPDLVLWRCAHGVMPLYTPVGGSWLNMAESIERVLKRRALDGPHPHSPAEIGSWFEQTAQRWNEQPTPFVWNGKRRQRRRRSGGDQTHRLGGSGACTHQPLRRNGATGASECQIQQQMTH